MKISRRHLFGLIPVTAVLATVQRTAIAAPPRFRGIVDYSAEPYSGTVLHFMARCEAGHPYHCFVDGVEIQQVWYVDFDKGIVKSQDVLYDNRAHHNMEPMDAHAVIRAAERDRAAGNVDLGWTYRPTRHDSYCRVLTKTIRGKIELRAS